MDLIKNLLVRYKNLEQTEAFKKDTIIKVINSRVGVCLDKKDLIIKNNKVRLKTSPKIKGEVYINKQSILTSLKELLGKDCPNDIC